MIPLGRLSHPDFTHSGKPPRGPIRLRDRRGVMAALPLVRDAREVSQSYFPFLDAPGQFSIINGEPCAGTKTGTDIPQIQITPRFTGSNTLAVTWRGYIDTSEFDFDSYVTFELGFQGFNSNDGMSIIQHADGAWQPIWKSDTGQRSPITTHAGTLFTKGEWHTVTVVFDGNANIDGTKSIFIYVDGKLDVGPVNALPGGNWTPGNGPTTLYIGHRDVSLLPQAGGMAGVIVHDHVPDISAIHGNIWRAYEPEAPLAVSLAAQAAILAELNAGAIALSGGNLLARREVNFSSGAASLSGASLSPERRPEAAGGSLALTGSDVLALREVGLSGGAISTTGSALSPILRASVSGGSITLSGGDILALREVALGAGAVTLAGNDLLGLREAALSEGAGSGSLDVSGADLLGLRDAALGVGSILLGGADVRLILIRVRYLDDLTSLGLSPTAPNSLGLDSGLNSLTIFPDDSNEVSE